MYKFSKNISFEIILLLFTFFLVIVFPNTFRITKIVLLLLLIIKALSSLKKINNTIITFYLSGLIITSIYIIIGSPKSSAPLEAANQAVLIYAITPLLWIIISTYIVDKFSIINVWKISIIYSILACFLVFIAVWLFDNGRIDILELIIDNPNKNLTSDGIIEVKLHVYGSMIFLFPAIMQTFKLFRFKIFFYVIVLLFLLTSFVSGREALMLSFLIGLFLFFVFNQNKKYILQIIMIFFIVVILDFILVKFDINSSRIVDAFITKINNGGESARSEQFVELYKGVNENIFGAGHGVGVSYIRSFTYPWRYEILPLALIFRVGIIGFIIYILPFIYSVTKFFKLYRMSHLNIIDRFMFSGLISIVIASFTNPYLESFEFQLFYVFPFIYFVNRKIINNFS